MPATAPLSYASALHAAAHKGVMPLACSDVNSSCNMDLAVAVRATLCFKQLMHEMMLHLRCGLSWIAKAEAMALTLSAAVSTLRGSAPPPSHGAGDRTISWVPQKTSGAWCVPALDPKSTTALSAAQWHMLHRLFYCSLPTALQPCGGKHRVPG